MKHGLSCLFLVAEEMISGHGEDCYCYKATKDRFLAAAFDGCGGSGARKYQNYSQQSGAYVASRAVSGSIWEWFASGKGEDAMAGYVQASLNVLKWYGDAGGRMLGSLGKDFPTTAAIITGTIGRRATEITCSWAGDSRCYLLNANGLHQLSADDLDGEDAMSNLYNDGVMTNVVNASVPFSLHQKGFRLNEPGILLAATDGCFGYLQSPMEFEHLLVDSLVSVQNIQGWKKELNDRIRSVAGDDYTLTVAGIGYGSFSEMQKSLYARHQVLEQQYLIPDCDPKILWERYKQEYSLYLN